MKPAIRFPLGDPTFFPNHQKALYRRLLDKDTNVEIDTSDPLQTRVILNMGPQHPATHGVLRAVLLLDGEKIQKAVIDIGYLHRGIEKIAEYKTFLEFLPYTDRMDYLSPYSNNVGYCLAVEKLLGIQAPPRAQYIRTIACELARISSHLLWLGTMVMDAGAVSMFMYTFREREKIYAIFDKLAGVRFTVSHSRIGGVQYDILPDTLADIQDFIKNFYKELTGWHKLLDRNPIFLHRVEGIGKIEKEKAIALGLTGPNLRACGVPYDIRLVEPYLVYDELDFEVPVYEEGDILARYHVRMEEMYQSARIIEQCIARLPSGPIVVDNAKYAYPSKDEVYYSMEGMIHDFMMTDTGPRAPEGAEVYHAIEAPKGELGFYLYSDGTGIPWRLKIKSPSFANIQVLEHLLEGAWIADAVLLIGSLDPVLGEADK
ncbi:MAG: NADH dehydrogenase (quinone) subunit D [Bacteroidia bacterium]